MNQRMFALLSLSVLIGCSPVIVKKDLVRPPVTIAEEKIQIVPETTLSVQQTFIDSLNRNKEIGLVESDFGSEINPTVIQTVEQTGTGLEIRYRIQIFASSSVESLREQKQIMEKSVNLPYFLAFEPPFYKLLVGDFQIRSEAEAMLPKIKKFGYTDAWIVTARANPSN